MSQANEETITHRIGEEGVLVLRSVSGSVRVRGIDGDEARIRAHLDLRRGEDPTGVLGVTRLEGELRVEVGGRSQRGLAGLLGSIPDGHLDVEIPRSATLRLTGVSADLEVAGIHGAQEYRTVSGDLTISGGGGAISLTSVSGDVRLAATVITLEASTTSGDIEVDAEQLEEVHVRSLSGDVRLAGALASGVPHSVQSVSGDLQLLPTGGLRLQVSGFSSDVDSELPYREDSRGGRRVLIIGDGAAEVSFRTMSGDASVLAGRFEGDAGEGASPPRHFPSAPPRPPRPPEPFGSSPSRASGATSSGVSAADRRLDILRAVERGEIDVEDATRLLEDATYD
ncbi:MAG: DUF4097 family beta strand repeat protein [Chloroflexi bacterium]|nr:DUF4097 family beta strand repeat protein [Chloroflexota bacterium]